MAVTSGFWDSVNGDRKYSGRQMMEIFDGIISDGVVSGLGNAFEVTKSGTKIYVGTGRAWFDGTWTYNNALYPVDGFTIPAAETSYNRVDAVVIRIDISNRVNSLEYLKGDSVGEFTGFDSSTDHFLAKITVPTSGASDATIVSCIGAGGEYDAPYASVYGISDQTYVKYDQGSSNANKVIVTGSTGKVGPSGVVSKAELETLNGIDTSKTVQSQINTLARGEVPIEIKTTALSIGAGHIGKFLMCKTANADVGAGASITITIPNSTKTDAGVPIGSEILICRYGFDTDRDVNIEPGNEIIIRAIDGVIISPETGKYKIKVSDPWGVCGLKKVYSNIWVAFGDYEIYS